MVSFIRRRWVSLPGLSTLSVETFTGTYYEFNLGADVGISVGAHASYSEIKNTGNFVIGLGANLGIGVSPVYGIDANLQMGIMDIDGNPFH